MPEEPWLKNPAWARGRIENRAPAFGLWIFALVFGLFAVAAARNTKWQFVPLAFWAVTATLLVLAIRNTLLAYRSRSVLVLETIPIPIGGKFRGHVEIATDPQHFQHARSISTRL